MVDHPLEKAGVFAVRMGKPLAENLRRTSWASRCALSAAARWLALISTGDRHAVASRGAGFCARGDWVWRWKDWIDRRFMRKFSEFPPSALPMAGGPQLLEEIPLDEREKTQAISAIAMRCGGCGAKVGATVLSRALAQVASPGARRRADRPACARRRRRGARAAGQGHGAHRRLFPRLHRRPLCVRPVAANHALGDIFAMGAEPQSATAMVPPCRRVWKQGRRHCCSR
jgi:selenide,water dikinase